MKETKLYINTNSFLNSINNITLFAWITWNQEQHLGCVVYSHCPTNDSYNKDTHGCCLPCNYATKSFGILQKVFKSQRVLISPYVWTQQKSLSFLSQKFVAKFADITLNFPVSWNGYPKKIQTTYQCAVFKKNDISSFFLSEKMSPHFKLHMETCSHFVRWVYFLILTFYHVNITVDQKWSKNLKQYSRMRTVCLKC